MRPIYVKRWQRTHDNTINKVYQSYVTCERLPALTSASALLREDYFTKTTPKGDGVFVLGIRKSSVSPPLLLMRTVARGDGGFGMGIRIIRY